MLFLNIPLLTEFINKYGEIINLFHVCKDRNNKLIFGIFVTENEVYVSGRNSHGKLGLGDLKELKGFEVINELSGKKIAEIFEGNDCMFAKTIGGDIYGWGGNNWGQLGRGHESAWAQYFEPQLIPAFKNGKIQNVYCGKFHNLALSSNGSVYGWGDNSCGQIGCDTEELTITTPTKIKFSFSERMNVKYIYCFMNSSFAIFEDEKGENVDVFIWGQNILFKELIKTENIMVPLKIPHLKASKIVCNEKSLYFTFNSHLYLYKSEEPIDKDVLDVFMHDDKVLIQKQNEIHTIKLSKVVYRTGMKTVQEYFIRQLKTTYGTANYHELKKALDESTIRSIGDSASVSSLSSLSSLRRSVSDCITFKGEGPGFFIEAMARCVAETNKIIESPPTETIDIPEIKCSECDLDQFVTEIRTFCERENERKLKKLLTLYQSTKYPQNLHELVNSTNEFERVFKDKYDIKMVKFTAINFAFRMLDRYKLGIYQIELFEDYFEFILSYFKLIHYENRIKVIQEIQSNLQNYQERKTLTKTVYNCLKEAYLFFESIVEHDEIFIDLSKQDYSQDQLFDDFEDEEEGDMLKFSSKTRAFNQWLKQSISDIHENQFQRGSSILISPGEYLKQANDVLKSPSTRSTTKSETTYYKFKYEEDEEYDNHNRWVIQDNNSKELLSYYKTKI